MTTFVSTLIKQAHKLPGELYPSLTWDRGKELADHQRFTLASDVDVYFCDPQSPPQLFNRYPIWVNSSHGSDAGKAP